MEQVVELKGLGNEFRRAAFDRVDRVLDRSETGHHDAHEFRISRERRTEQLGPVDPGQSEIGQYDIERKLAELFKRRLAALDRHHLVAMFRQALRGDLPQRRLIFYEQEIRVFFRHAV